MLKLKAPFTASLLLSNSKGDKLLRTTKDIPNVDPTTHLCWIQIVLISNGGGKKTQAAQKHVDWKFPANLCSPFCGEKPCWVGPTPGGAGNEFASFAPHSCQ